MIVSSAVTVMVPESQIDSMSQITGDIYGLIVNPPLPVQVPRFAPVVPGSSTILDMVFPVGVEMVTVESVIVALSISVGALKVITGGNLIVVEELFPAISYTVTTIV